MSTHTRPFPSPAPQYVGSHLRNVSSLTITQVYENMTDVTSYSYDSSKRELVTYDTPHIASIKAQYVRDNGLAGSMFWEVRVSR